MTLQRSTPTTFLWRGRNNKRRRRLQFGAEISDMTEDENFFFEDDDGHLAIYDDGHLRICDQSITAIWIWTLKMATNADLDAFLHSYSVRVSFGFNNLKTCFIVSMFQASRIHLSWATAGIQLT